MGAIDHRTTPINRRPRRGIDHLESGRAAPEHMMRTYWQDEACSTRNSHATQDAK